jgi:hypothetical protein
MLDSIVGKDNYYISLESKSIFTNVVQNYYMLEILVITHICMEHKVSGTVCKLSPLVYGLYSVHKSGKYYISLPTNAQ